MPVIYSEDGFDVVIYPKDHRPPHVHIFKAGGVAIVEYIGLPLAPNIRDVYGMKAKQAKRAFEIAEAKQADFMAKWGELHGDH